MKMTLIFSALFLLTRCYAPAAAGEPVPWGAPAYGDQFKYFHEQRTQDQESWETLAPEDQLRELETVKEPAGERRDEVLNFYNDAMQKWDPARMRHYMGAIRSEDIRAVSLWVGPDGSGALVSKINTLRAIAEKSGRESLDAADISALEPYLTQDAIAGIRSVKPAADSAAKPKPGKQDKWAPSKSGGNLNEFAGANPSRLPDDKLSKLYTGGEAGGGAEPDGGAHLNSLKGSGAKAGILDARKPLATTLATGAPPGLAEGGRSGVLEAPDKNDAAHLERVLDGTVARKVAEGKRLPGRGSIPSILNSAYGIWNGGKTDRCYDLAESLMADIAKSYGKEVSGNKFTDPSGRWQFKIDTYYGEGHEASGHYWVTAVSNNPGDPTLVLDPSLGIVTAYKEKNPVLKKGFLLYTEGYFIDMAQKTWAAVRPGK